MSPWQTDRQRPFYYSPVVRSRQIYALGYVYKHANTFAVTHKQTRRPAPTVCAEEVTLRQAIVLSAA